MSGPNYRNADATSLFLMTFTPALVDGSYLPNQAYRVTFSGHCGADDGRIVDRHLVRSADQHGDLHREWPARWPARWPDRLLRGGRSPSSTGFLRDLDCARLWFGDDGRHPCRGSGQPIPNR